MPDKLETKADVRRAGVRHVIATCPADELLLLRARLWHQAQIISPDACAVCWEPRPSEMDAHTEERHTCTTVRCRVLWNDLRHREAEIRMANQLQLAALYEREAA